MSDYHYNGISREKVDELVDEALFICKKKRVHKVSAQFFQREMGLDGELATIVYNELCLDKVIVDTDMDPEDQDLIVGYINKEKLKELTQN